MKVEFAIAGPGAGSGEKNVNVAVRRVLIDIGRSPQEVWDENARLKAESAQLRERLAAWRACAPD